MSRTITSALILYAKQDETRIIDTMAEKYEDRELIRLLRGSQAMQDRALVFIMDKMKTDIIKHLYNQGCKDAVAAESFFLEGITKGMHSIVKGDFREDGSVVGYFKKICYRLWLSAMRSDNARKAREEKVGHTITTADLTAEDLIFQEQRAILLNEILDKLGKGCADIMLLKAGGYSTKEIVNKTDYSSISSVDKRNSICMDKLRQLMKDNPQVMKLLKELHEK